MRAASRMQRRQIVPQQRHPARKKACAVGPDVGHPGEGRVKVGNSVWSGHGEDAVIGTKVRLVGAEGIVLRVKGVVDQ